MKCLGRTTHLGIFLVTLIVTVCCSARRLPHDRTSNPFIINIEALQENKTKMGREGEHPKLRKALSDLVKEADGLLKSRDRSVVEKKRIPPSGDIHDYLSMATYYWPDPSKPNGEPYIHKDGKTNPEIGEIKDNSNLIRMVKQVNTLALAYYYTNEEKYAEKAVEKVKVWFLDPQTRMNPNLNHAQYIPGRNDGRVVGLIDSRELVDLIDGLQLLSSSDHWNSSTEIDVKAWFSDFLFWLQNSELGKSAEEKLENNIATAYYMQIIAYALYVGDTSIVHKVVEVDLPRLIDVQIDPEGKQIFELSRANSWGYSEANLTYWFKIARLSEHVGIKLLDKQTRIGRALLLAFNWMAPYTREEKEWTYSKVRQPDFAASGRRLANARTRLSNTRTGLVRDTSLNSLSNSQVVSRSLDIPDSVSAYEILTEFNK